MEIDQDESSGSSTKAYFNEEMNQIKVVSPSSYAENRSQLSPRSVMEDQEDYLYLDEDSAVEAKESEPGFEETVILLDYDDTILASSWLSSRQLGLASPDSAVAEHAEELRVLEACAAKLLSKLIELGDVHLVTNAEEGWIQMTVEKFMPALRPLLPHVSIISARSTFEEYHPCCPRTWKVMAFRQQISESLSGRLALTDRKINVISMGDSQHEREALRIVTSEMQNTFAKSVKFVERPTLDVLQRQMELVHSCMDYICSYVGDLDLMLSQIISHGPQ